MSDPMFSDLSEMRRGDLQEPRDLESELFNKKSIRDMVVSFEAELGINPGKKNKKSIKRHAEVLAPGKDDDAIKLSSILNEDEKYRVLMWKDTWTVHGDYRVFLVYEEQLEEKKDK